MSRSQHWNERRISSPRPQALTKSMRRQAPPRLDRQGKSKRVHFISGHRRDVGHPQEETCLQPNPRAHPEWPPTAPFLLSHKPRLTLRFARSRRHYASAPLSQRPERDFVWSSTRSTWSSGRDQPRSLQGRTAGFVPGSTACECPFGSQSKIDAEKIAEDAATTAKVVKGI